MLELDRDYAKWVDQIKTYLIKNEENRLEVYEDNKELIVYKETLSCSNKFSRIFIYDLKSPGQSASISLGELVI